MTIPTPESAIAADRRHWLSRRGGLLIGGLSLAVLGASLLASSDDLDWETIDQGHFIDVAADAADKDTVLATTGTSELRSYDTTGRSKGLEITDSQWYAASDQGLFSSVDTGSSWRALITYGDPT